MATLHVWTAEGVVALKPDGLAVVGEGLAAAARRVPIDQVEEIEEGCVTWWGVRRAGLPGPLTVTVWPDEGRAAAGGGAGGESAWGAYDAELGLVTLEGEEGDAELIMHEATAPAVGRAGAARADEFFARATAGELAWPEAPSGAAFLEWRAAMRKGGLPGPGDAGALARAVRALAGRAPTDHERQSFEEAFFERLWSRRLEASAGRQ